MNWLLLEHWAFINGSCGLASASMSQRLSSLLGRNVNSSSRLCVSCRQTVSKPFVEVGTSIGDKITKMAVREIISCSQITCLFIWIFWSHMVEVIEQQVKVLFVIFLHLLSISDLIILLRTYLKLN